MWIWSLLNQVQMFFLLLLTRAYIPFDIQTEITGPDFTLNIYWYIPFKKIGFSIIEKFNFDLTNTLLEPLKVKSDSTIYNTYPFFSFLLIIGWLHVLVYIFFRLISKWNIGGRCSKCKRLIHWLIKWLLYSTLSSLSPKRPTLSRIREGLDKGDFFFIFQNFLKFYNF